MIQDHKIAKIMFPKWRKGKTGKYKKKGKKVSHTLTQDDVEFLKKNTRYDEQEIKEWYRWVQTYALMLRIRDGSLMTLWFPHNFLSQIEAI